MFEIGQRVFCIDSGQKIPLSCAEREERYRIFLGQEYIVSKREVAWNKMEYIEIVYMKDGSRRFSLAKRFEAL
jgi:hypothetical protein